MQHMQVCQGAWPGCKTLNSYNPARQDMFLYVTITGSTAHWTVLWASVGTYVFTLEVRTLMAKQDKV